MSKKLNSTVFSHVAGVSQPKVLKFLLQFFLTEPDANNMAEMSAADFEELWRVAKDDNGTPLKESLPNQAKAYRTSANKKADAVWFAVFAEFGLHAFVEEEMVASRIGTARATTTNVLLLEGNLASPAQLARGLIVADRLFADALFNTPEPAKQVNTATGPGFAPTVLCPAQVCSFLLSFFLCYFLFF